MDPRPDRAKSGGDSAPAGEAAKGSDPVKRLAWVSITVLAALSACSRPAETSKTAQTSATAAGPLVERPGPIKWNASTGAFELNGKALKSLKLWTFDGSTE